MPRAASPAPKLRPFSCPRLVSIITGASHCLAAARQSMTAAGLSAFTASRAKRRSAATRSRVRDWRASSSMSELDLEVFAVEVFADRRARQFEADAARLPAFIGCVEGVDRDIVDADGAGLQALRDRHGGAEVAAEDEEIGRAHV